MSCHQNLDGPLEMCVSSDSFVRDASPVRQRAMRDASSDGARDIAVTEGSLSPNPRATPVGATSAVGCGDAPGTCRQTAKWAEAAAKVNFKSGECQIHEGDSFFKNQFRARETTKKRRDITDSAGKISREVCMKTTK